MDFKGIFDRHFFSNHHVEAKRLEARLEQMFLPGYECVTYSSFPGLLTAALDELCAGDLKVYVKVDEPLLWRFNAFFRATGRSCVHAWSGEVQAKVAAMSKGATPGLVMFINAVLVRDKEVVGLLMDFAECSDFLESAAVFVTPDAVLAEKVRWSRSSYGRRIPASVKIAANGRFSEFQGQLLNWVLDEAGYGG